MVRSVRPGFLRSRLLGLLFARSIAFAFSLRLVLCLCAIHWQRNVQHSELCDRRAIVTGKIVDRTQQRIAIHAVILIATTLQSSSYL